MTNISPLPSNKSTSFHSVALNIIYVAILTICHFTIPYIHELVFSFFNGFFLIVSIILFFYLNAVIRTSSITHFSFVSLFFRIISSTIFLAFSIIAISFITNTTEIIIRNEYIKFIFYVSVFCLLAMFMVRTIYYQLKPKIQSKVILLTDCDHIQNSKIKNLLSDDQLTIKEFKSTEIDSLINYAIHHKAEALYIYIDSKQLNSLEILLKDLSIYAFSIYWILPESIFNEAMTTETIKPILLNGSPVNLDTNQYLIKRSMDVFGSLAILLLTLPFVIIVSISIKVTDFGPILYHQKRYGRNGTVFNMIKFRSMKINSHNPEMQVSNDDERVTAIGNIIRKTSFDEIPQLINVLRGEMALVGPRPQTEEEITIYSKKLFKFLTRHHVKPGLTGLAQIRSRVKTDSVALMNEKLTSDLEYIKNWSLYLDLKIIILTPISMWKNRKFNT